MRLSRGGTAYRLLRRARGTAVRAGKRLSAVHPTGSVHHTARVSRDLRADEYAFVGPECWIGPGVRIGRYAMLAPRVAVVGDDHVIDAVGVPMQFAGRPPQQVTTIGADAWVGYGAVVRRGVTIGEGAVVGAGSVVTRDVPAYEVWGGAPARRIRDRFTPEERERHAAALRGPVTPVFTEPQELDPA